MNANPIPLLTHSVLSRDGDSIWLQGGSFLIDTLPYVGTVKGFQQAFSGVNKMTGTQFSTGERWAEGVGSTMSFIPLPGMKHVGKYGTDGAVNLWKRLDLQFFAGKSKSTLAKPGEDLFVGTYNQSRYGNKKTGLNKTHTPHHVVQDAVSQTTHGKGITINIQKGIHEQTATFGTKRNLNNPREHLAADIFELRNLLRQNGYEKTKINAQLQELIMRNKNIGGFDK